MGIYEKGKGYYGGNGGGEHLSKKGTCKKKGALIRMEKGTH